MMRMCYSDTDADQSNTWRALCDLDLDSLASADDVAIMRYLCSAWSIRTAQIVTASMLQRVMVCLLIDDIASRNVLTDVYIKVVLLLENTECEEMER